MPLRVRVLMLVAKIGPARDWRLLETNHYRRTNRRCAQPKIDGRCACVLGDVSAGCGPRLACRFVTRRAQHAWSQCATAASRPTTATRTPDRRRRCRSANGRDCRNRPGGCDGSCRCRDGSDAPAPNTRGSRGTRTQRHHHHPASLLTVGLPTAPYPSQSARQRRATSYVHSPRQCAWFSHARQGQPDARCRHSVQTRVKGQTNCSSTRTRNLGRIG